MLSLQKHHITDLFVLVDDLLPKQNSKTVGRPSILSDSEIVTILLWNSLALNNKTLRGILNSIAIYHKDDFPQLPHYKTFVSHCHRVIPQLLIILEEFLLNDSRLLFLDSTMLPVCKIKRAGSHKVAKDIAAFGKNHQGWHFGFKLHASINHKNQLCGIAFTPANIYDAQKIKSLIRPDTKVAVGDSHYGASVMRKKVWEEHGVIIIAPPHYSQKKKIAAWWQNMLISARSKIESVFDILKEHMHLVSSFPRSPKGYLLHYLRILISYQILAIF